MQTRLNPYISFEAQTREGMEFYKTIFGGTLTLSTFEEAGAPVEPEEKMLIMHAMLEADNGIVLMASDTPKHMGEYKSGTNIGISLSGDNDAELRGYGGKLSVGATITVPLDKAPWGDTFGMLTDKFGIGWLVNIAARKA